MSSIQKAGLNNFDEIFEIMTDSFPDTEMRNYEGQKKLFDLDLYEVFIYKTNEKTAAFISVWNFDEFIFIEHLAVSKLMRGHGTGTKLIEFIKTHFGKKIILEVEPPDYDIAVKRIGFYKKLSFKLNLYDYMQPALQKGLPDIKLLLMSYPDFLSNEEFEKYKSILYKTVYEKIE